MVALIARRGVQHVVQEYGPISYRQLSALQPLEDLIPVISLQADLDGFLQKAVAVGGDPGGHRAIPLPHHTVHRDGD